MNDQNYLSSKQATTSPANEPSKKRKWLKSIIWIFSSIILIIILFFSLPYIFSILWGEDSQPPDDKDLLLSVVNIPKNENSYFDLIKLSDILDGETKKAQVKIEIPNGINDLEYLKSYDWGIDKVEELLEKNKEALTIFSEAAIKPQFQFDITADPAIISPDMPVVTLNPWRQIARISSINAIYLMRQGNNEAAFAEAMKSIIIGNQIEKSKNVPLIAYLVGIRIKQIGLETMQTLISYSSASPGILSNYQNEILKYYSVNNDDPFRGEYMNQKKASKYIIEGLSEGIGKIIVRNNFYFKPNKTHELSAGYFRQQINKFNGPCADSSSIVIYRPEISWRLYLKLYFTENSVGKLLASMAHTALEKVRDKKCYTDVIINATDILFAIKKYHLENSSYPTNLNDLVPKYINKLPPDPYSGKNFVLNKEKMAIYSIGYDYKDNGGGDLERNWTSMDDPSFSYNFTVK